MRSTVERRFSARPYATLLDRHPLVARRLANGGVSFCLNTKPAPFIWAGFCLYAFTCDAENFIYGREPVYGFQQPVLGHGCHALLFGDFADLEFVDLF